MSGDAMAILAACIAIAVLAAGLLYVSWFRWWLWKRRNPPSAGCPDCGCALDCWDCYGSTDFVRTGYACPCTCSGYPSCKRGPFRWVAA